MVQVTKNDKDFLMLNAMVKRYGADGKMQLDKDKEAVRSYFLQEVNPNTVFYHDLEEKLNFLFEQEYYDKTVFDKYSFEFVKSLYKHAYDYKFRFSGFVPAYKFYSQYSMKTYDGERWLERFEDRVVANGLLLAEGKEQLAINIIDEIMTGRLVPATPTFLNAGRKQRGSFISCFLMEVSDDLNSIGRSINSALQLSKNGGGVAFNLTNCRAKGDPIKGYKGAASGIRPIAKLYENSFSYANQLGARQGAGAVYLNAHHLDIIDFLDMRKIAGDSKYRLESLSMGVVIPNITMELFRKGLDMYLFSPYDVSRKYGINFADVDITEKYQELVDDPSIRKSKVPAREFFSKIAQLQVASGYPYLVFEGNANEQNPIEGRIKQSNLCSEILQVQKPSVLNDDQSYADLGRDVVCNLSSLNASNIMKSEDMGKSIDVAVRALTWVTDHNEIDTVPSIKAGNDEAHAIGLGVMNLHGWFAENNLTYGSPESVEAAETLAYLMNYHSLSSSNRIAIETGEWFDGFRQSEYASGKYFDKYISHPHRFEFESVAKIFEGTDIPAVVDWESLKDSVAIHGVYHQNRHAVAPTGSISYINNATAGAMPVKDVVESRQEKMMGTVFYPAPGLTESNVDLYQDGYAVGWKGIIDVIAGMQKHIDQSISTELFFPDDVSTKEINKAQYYAWSKGLKSIYYIRTRNSQLSGTQDRECIGCQV